MKIIAWILFLITWVLCAFDIQDAFAIPVTFVHLESERVMSEELTANLIEEVVAVYKIAGVHLQPKLVHRIPDQPWLFEFSSFDYLPHLLKEFPGLSRRREPVHFLSEALWDRFHALQYFIGYSFPVQRKSVSTAQEFSVYGDNYHRVCVAGAIHELGHDLGATHVHDCSIMDTNILHCINDGGALFWGDRAIHEFRRFKTRWRMGK